MDTLNKRVSSNLPSAIRSNRTPAQTTSTTEAAPEGVDAEIIQITNLLASTSKDEQTEFDVINICSQYLGYSSYSVDINLDSAEFQRRKTALLELALELYDSKNEEGAQLIASGIKVRTAYNAHYGDEEVNFYCDKYRGPISIRLFNMMTLRIAADSGRKVAQYVLGKLFAQTDNENRDPELARHYLQLSADQGYQPAIDALKDLPETAVQQAQRFAAADFLKAFKLFVEAPQESDSDKQYKLGMLHLKNGRKLLAALLCFYSATKDGHNDAKNQIERLFFSMTNEDACNMLSDLKKVIKPDPSNDLCAFYPIITCQLGKRFVQLGDGSRALGCFEMVNFQGVEFESADIYAEWYENTSAKFMYSNWYEKAIDFYARANTSKATLKSLVFQIRYAKGSALRDAQCELGKLYLTGSASPYPQKDIGLDMKYLMLAANNGHGEAAYILSYLLSDEQEAARYFRIAVKAGYELACLEKAVMDDIAEDVVALNITIAKAKYLINLHSKDNESISPLVKQDKLEKFTNRLGQLENLLFVAKQNQKARAEEAQKAAEKARAKAAAEAQAKVVREAQAKAAREAQAKVVAEARAKTAEEAQAKAAEKAQAKAAAVAQANAEREAALQKREAALRAVIDAAPANVGDIPSAKKKELEEAADALFDY